MAHGLVLQLKEMLQRNLVNRKEPYENFSAEEKIIKSWIVASSQSKFYRLEFFRLLRKTLLLVLSPLPLNEAQKKEVLSAINTYFGKFPNMPKGNREIYKPLVGVVLEPWKNVFLTWDEFFQGRISFTDQNVQKYFANEPEEIVCARVNSLLCQGKEEKAMALAKNSFLYCSRISKSLCVSTKNPLGNTQKSQSVLPSNKYRPGTSSLDWYLFILQRKKSLPSIVNEMDQLTCHEGVQLILRLRRIKKHSFAFTLLQTLLMQDLVKPSNYCCTKEFFSLWCIMHKERKSSTSEISLAVRKMLAVYAPSSAHFYLFVDALWEQFGSSLITLYVELYIRGLTVDINYLEAAKHGEVQDDVGYLECHIAMIFSKLSTLFSDFHEGAARECMFSAFSLKPTKERLYILQSYTHSILSSENEMKLNCSLNNNLTSQECKCDVRCNGSCKGIKEYYLDHPILKKGISNVPYVLVKDLVSVLESVRCTRFQYNLFDWHNNATDLGDYLKDFILSKSWESDTEYASEGSNRSDVDERSIKNPNYPSQISSKSVLTAKRKSESVDGREMFAFDIGANIEISNEEGLNKRIKILDQSLVNEVKKDIFANQIHPVQNLNSLGMEDAIENVIRMQLDNSKQKLDMSLNNNFLGTSLSYTNDGTEMLSLTSDNKHVSGNNVFQYSLGPSGDRRNFSSSFRSVESVKSNVQSASKFVANIPKSSSDVIPTVFITRESVISPTHNYHEKFTVQEQSNKQAASFKFYSHKAAHHHVYGNSKGNLMTDTNKKVYRQEVCNPVSINSYDQVRNVHNTVSQSSQTYCSKASRMKVMNKPVTSVSPTDLSRIQFLPVANVSHPSSMTSVNFNKTEETLSMQHPRYPSASQSVSNSSVYRSDSRFQYVSHGNVNNAIVKRHDQSVSCFQENQVMHCDRSSVIQHTMQHANDSSNQHEMTEAEMPRQLAVSVNCNAAEQIRNVPKDEITNIPPFTVSVSDKTMSNSSLAVPANLVIARKAQPQTEIVPQPVCNSITTVINKETITIPGILASPSVIVTPCKTSSWETQHKNHGKLMYKKNANAVSNTCIDKRIYKCRTPYTKQVFVKPEPKTVRQTTSIDKNCQILKAVASSSHINPTIIALQQNSSNSSQIWSVVSKTSTSSAQGISQSASTQGIPQSTSSQPWYSEPFPKPSKLEYSQSAVNSNAAIEQNASNTPLQSVKPLAAHYKKTGQIRTQNMPSAPPIVSRSLNAIPVSSTTTNVGNLRVPSSLNVSPHSLLSECIVHEKFASVASSTSQSNINAKVFSTQSSQVNEPQLLNLCVDKSQYEMVLLPDKNAVAFSTTAVEDAKLCHILSNKFPNSCCSPSEINPCQNCSIRTDVMPDPAASQFSSNLSLGQTIQSNRKMMPDEVLTSASCDTRLISDVNDASDLMFSDMNESCIMCPYCSNSFLESELQLHILNDHPKEFGVKNNFVTDVNSSKMLTENVCASVKLLPDVVPEQESLFHGESFQTDLPHTKSVASSVDGNQNVGDDNRNFVDMDENLDAFNACMDLINNDKDLKRMVQGIDSLEQIENNYLPFIPVPDSAGNFLNSNLCNEVEKTDISEIPLQNLPKTENNECKEYAAEFSCPQVEGNKVNPTKALSSVFDFTEKDYDASKPSQNLAPFKIPANYTDKIPADNPKESSELTFSALTEMIKVAIDDSNNEEHTVEDCINNSNENASFIPTGTQKLWSCLFCSKFLCSVGTLKRHILKLHPDVSIEDWKSVLQPRLCEIPFNNLDLNSPLEDDMNSMHTDSNSSLNAILPLETKQNQEISHASGIGVALPKGRCRSGIKSATTQCKFCNKFLTSVYMKKHIQTQHSEISGRTENSSSDLNLDGHNSSASQLETPNFTAALLLPEQDIDSSTCLSVSDALKRNNSYTVTGISSPSNGSDKVTDDTDVKFNFNVLEFSKNTGIDTSKESHDTLNNVKICTTAENTVKVEETIIKANVTYTKKCGFVLDKHQCYVCSKTYTAVSSLNKHLKTIHKITDIPRAPRKSKCVKNLQKVESGVKVIGKCHPVTSGFSHVRSKPRNTLLEKGTSVQSSAISCSTKSTILAHAINSAPKNVELHKKPMLNCNLLKTVLKSNFVSKQMKENDLKLSSKTVLPEKDGFKNVCPASETSENDSEQVEVQLNEIKCLSTIQELSSPSQCVVPNSILDPDVQCSSKVVTSVPSQESETSKDCVPLFEEEKNITSTKSDNELQASDVNLQTACPNVTNSALGSQTLSVQSNEISSVSEIISNVSKCQFVATSNEDNEKKLVDDNSLKLLIPRNEKESSNDVDENKIAPIAYGQESIPEQGSNSVDISVSFDNSLCNSNDGIVAADSCNSEMVEDIIVETNLDEQAVVSCDSDNNLDKVCRLCHQKLSSMDCLSKHLKLIHNIPVLKKHVSQLGSSQLTQEPQESEKLCPPKLRLGTSDSDSESVSDYDNVRNSLKTSYDSFDSGASQNEITEIFKHSSTSSSCSENSQKENSANTLTCNLKVSVQLDNTVSNSSLKDSSTSLISHPSNSLVFNSESQLKQVTAASSACRHRSRRHSFSDTKSFFIAVKKLQSSSYSKSLHRTLSGCIRKKHISLPNLQFVFQPMEIAEETERQSMENTCSSSISDDIESSKNCPARLSSTCSDSNFLKPNSKFNSSISKIRSSRLKMKTKLPGKKLLRRYKSYKRVKGFKKKVKTKYLKQYQSRKTYKPFILTLKEATEVSEFLKTHKQPIVNLIRLKENESRLLNRKDDSTLHVLAKHGVKESVVKLERMHIPNDFGDLFILNQNFTLSSLLSHNNHFNSMQNHENSLNDFHLGSSEVDFSHSEISATDENLTEESIELSNGRDFDSDTVIDEHERRNNLINEEKYLNEECCTFPLKKCSVILKRVSI